jgi:hypothetical protein
MWAYFSRDDVALPGLASWFAACSLEERDHGACVARAWFAASQPSLRSSAADGCARVAQRRG